MVDLVSTLATTQPRRTLLKGLLEYRGLLAQLGYTTGLQLIDGSFAEQVELRETRAPNDIDVFSFVERPSRYRADPSLWVNTGFLDWTQEVVERAKNRARFGLDTYAVAIDQAGPWETIIAAFYWSSLFAHKRITHDWKGFLQVPLNQSDDSAALSALGI
jgi:hypothetical protein